MDSFQVFSIVAESIGIQAFSFFSSDAIFVVESPAGVSVFASLVSLLQLDKQIATQQIAKILCFILMVFGFGMFKVNKNKEPANLKVGERTKQETKRMKMIFNVLPANSYLPHTLQLQEPHVSKA